MYVLTIGAVVDDENTVRLVLYNQWHKENEKYIKLDLGDCWLTDEIGNDDSAHGYVYNKKEHAPIVDSGSIDLDPLYKAAADALTAINRADLTT